jgi:hypothetical protein
LSPASYPTELLHRVGPDGSGLRPCHHARWRRVCRQSARGPRPTGRSAGVLSRRRPHGLARPRQCAAPRRNEPDRIEVNLQDGVSGRVLTKPPAGENIFSALGWSGRSHRVMTAANQLRRTDFDFASAARGAPSHPVRAEVFTSPDWSPPMGSALSFQRDARRDRGQAARVRGPSREKQGLPRCCRAGVFASYSPTGTSRVKQRTTRPANALKSNRRSCPDERRWRAMRTQTHLSARRRQTNAMGPTWSLPGRSESRLRSAFSFKPSDGPPQWVNIATHRSRTEPVTPHGP